MIAIIETYLPVKLLRAVLGSFFCPKIEELLPRSLWQAPLPRSTCVLLWAPSDRSNGPGWSTVFTMDQSSQTGVTPVRLAEHFARSDKFRELFTYGMDLVEETASFLDAEGRIAAKSLSKKINRPYTALSPCD